jgi:hypothetical protein
MDPNQAADTLSSLVVYEAEVNGIASSMAPSLHPNGSGPAGLSSSSSSGRAAPSSGAVTDMAGSPSDVRGASGQGDERAREPTEQVSQLATCEHMCRRMCMRNRCSSSSNGTSVSRHDGLWHEHQPAWC